MKKNIEEGHLVDLPEEGKKLLEEEREERRRAMEDLREKSDINVLSIDKLIGTMTVEEKIEEQNIGQLGEFICKFCQALLWKKENKSICCNTNKVSPIIPPEIENEDLKSLYEGKSALSERFLDNIVGFNLVFAFTSFTTSNRLENAAETAMCYKLS